MSLKINLKPGEKIIIGKTLLRNGEFKGSFTIEGEEVPILRERYILSEEDVKTPVQLLYFYIQLMYVSTSNAAEFHEPYFEQLKEVLKAAPSMMDILMAVTESVRDENYFQALRQMQDALKYEEQILNFMSSEEEVPEGEANE